MTHWLDDFEKLLQFYRDPDVPSSEDIHELLLQFLIHVPNHLAAASKLYKRLPTKLQKATLQKIYEIAEQAGVTLK